MFKIKNLIKYISVPIIIGIPVKWEISNASWHCREIWVRWIANSRSRIKNFFILSGINDWMRKNFYSFIKKVEKYCKQNNGKGIYSWEGFITQIKKSSNEICRNAAKKKCQNKLHYNLIKTLISRRLAFCHIAHPSINYLKNCYL